MPIRTGGAGLSIAGGIREFAIASPGATAVIDGDRSLTFAALDERASRLGQHLLGQGLRPGDRVAVLLGNRLEYPEIAAGIAKAGLVMVPLNPRSTPGESRYILEHAGARAWCSTTRSRPSPATSTTSAWWCSASAAPSSAPTTTPSWPRADARDPARTRRRARPVLHRLHLRHHRPPQGRRHLPPQPGADVLPERARVGPRPGSYVGRRRADVPRRRVRLRLRAGLRRRHRHHARPLGPRGVPRPAGAGPGAVDVPGADPRADAARARRGRSPSATCRRSTRSTSTRPPCRGRSSSG